MSLLYLLLIPVGVFLTCFVGYHVIKFTGDIGGALGFAIWMACAIPLFAVFFVSIVVPIYLASTT